MRDRVLNDKAGLPFLSLIRALRWQSHVLTTRYVDRKIYLIKVVKISLIKDMSKPLYRTRANRLGGLAIFPQSALQQPLPFKGFVVVPPSDKASDQPEGNSALHPMYQGPKMYAHVRYEFLSWLVINQWQTRAMVDQMVKWMPQVV